MAKIERMRKSIRALNKHRFRDLIGFSVLVLLPGYMIYKSIRKKIENFGNKPEPHSIEEFKANVAKAKGRQNAIKHPKGAYGRHPFTGARLHGRASHRRRFFGH